MCRCADVLQAQSSRLDLATITLLSLVSLLGTSVSAAEAMTRDAALAASPRVRIETPSLSGSISLRGARIDDLSLLKYRETVDPNSPPIVLLAHSRIPHPSYAEFGWSAPSGGSVKLPDSDTLWQQQGSGALSVGRPVTLVYDNGQGLQFRRTIAVDDKYLFTLKDEVINNGAAPVTLYPFALISRHGTPQTLGLYIVHEGLIGVFGDKGLQEETTPTSRSRRRFHSPRRMSGSALPTSIGPQRSSPIPRPKSRRSFRPARSATTSRPTKATISARRRPSRPAAPPSSTGGCSAAIPGPPSRSTEKS